MADSPPPPPPWLIIAVAMFTFLQALAWRVALVSCVYLGVTLPVRETAGEVTIIGIAYEIIGDFRLHVVVPYVAAATFGILWK